MPIDVQGTSDDLLQLCDPGAAGTFTLCFENHIRHGQIQVVCRTRIVTILGGEQVCHLIADPFRSSDPLQHAKQRRIGVPDIDLQQFLLALDGLLELGV